MAPGQYLALEALYNVSRRADETIVLENSVCDTPARSAEQNVIMIKDSQWAQRLWTIREGAIAKSLKIQFKDSALDMLEIIKEYSSALTGHLVSYPRSRSNSSDGIMSRTKLAIRTYIYKSHLFRLLCFLLFSAVSFDYMSINSSVIITPSYYTG